MTFVARTRSDEPLVGDAEGFVPLSAAASGMESMTEALGAAASGQLPDPADATADQVERATDQFAAPVPRPTTILGIGLNYADHAADLSEQRPSEPASFMKPPSTVTGPGGPIRLPPAERTDRITAEAELAVVFGRTCKAVDRETATEVIAGFVPVIDVTAEDVLERNPRFLTRAKSFDTFLVQGPYITVPDDPGAVDDLEVRTIVNGEVVAGNTVDRMLFDPFELVSFQSHVQPFRPGDVLLTGTPGAAEIHPGDRVQATISEIGTATAEVTRPSKPADADV